MKRGDLATSLGRWYGKDGTPAKIVRKAQAKWGSDQMSKWMNVHQGDKLLVLGDPQFVEGYSFHPVYNPKTRETLWFPTHRLLLAET